MILWIIIIFIILLVSYLLLNYFYKHSVAYRNQFFDVLKLKNHIPDNLKIVNLGSTYSMYAFNSYKQLNLKAFNFALDSQCLEIDNVILRKYRNKFADSAVVIICLAACVPFYRYSMVKDKTKYYKFLKSDELPEFSLFEYVKNKIPLNFAKFKSMISSMVKMNEKYDIVDGYPSSLSTELRERNMKSMADGWMKLFNLPNLKENNDNPANISNKQFNTDLLKSMLVYCFENNLKPVITIPPFSKDLNNYFSDAFVQDVLLDMIDKAKEGMDVPVLNYRTSSQFQLDYSSFVDGGFRLSKSGSMKFSRILFNDLNSLGYCLNNRTIGL